MYQYLYFIVMEISLYASIAWESHHTFDELLKGFFLYHNFEDPFFNFLDPISCFMLCSVFLFCYFLYGMSLFRAAGNFRLLVLHRYRSKNAYLWYCFRKGVCSAMLTLILLSVSFVIFCTLNGFSISACSQEQMAFLLLMLLNIFLFFLFCILLNIFILLKKNQATAIVVTAMLTIIIILAGVYINGLSILTYGDLSVQLWNAGVLTLLNLFFFFFIRYHFKTRDL